jgi:hypothetical protein
MTDEDLDDIDAAPPAVPAAPPWQARLEAVALLLLATVAITLVARLVGAYDQAKGMRELGASIDLVRVVRFAGEQTGLIAAAGVLLAFLLVTLGPGGRFSSRGVLALRASTVLGLLVAGITAFAGIGSIVSSDQSAPYGSFRGAAIRSTAARLSTGVPLLLAAAIAGYVAWCAFSTLGERPRVLFPEADDGEGDLVEASEGRWDPPAPGQR